MSAYEVEASKYDNVFNAIADSFSPGYDVHDVAEVDPDVFYVLASYDGKIQAYEYRVDYYGGLYSMKSCTIDMDTAVSADPALKTVAENHGAI